MVESRNAVFIETLPICLSPPGGIRRIKISSHRRTISTTTRSTTTTSRTTTCCGTSKLHFCSGFRRRHACRKGKNASASTSVTRRNFAWGSLACGKFAGGVTSKGSSPPPAPTPSSAAPKATNGQPITVPWESPSLLGAGEPQAFCLCLSLHVRGRPQQQQSSFGGAF